MKGAELLPRVLLRPNDATRTDGTALADLVLRQRGRMNGEDRALVEQMVVDALHAIAVAEYLRTRDGVRGARRLRGCRGEAASSRALVRAVLAYAEVSVDPTVEEWLGAEFTVRMRHAIGRGYATRLRQEEQQKRAARPRGRRS